MTYAVKPVEDVVGLAHIRTLFTAYGDWIEKDLGISLEFQGFAAEMAGLPGKYAPPRGGLWVAVGEEGSAGGCVALRPFDGDTCEIKRLYVRPANRGTGLGRRLAETVIDGARLRGYARILLDTGPTMVAAQGLYRTLGFRDIDPYYHNPVPDCLFMELRLHASASR